MTSQTTVPAIDSTIFGQIKSDVKQYASILCVLDKAENDAYLPLLSSALQFIFQKEMGYAISGGVIRAGKDERKSACDRSELPNLHKHSDL